MDIEEIVNKTDNQTCKQVMTEFLSNYLNPAFGALPKGEVELLVLNLLQQLHAVSEEPEVYELVSNLRITRTKARKLIYESGLRKSSPAELDLKVKQLLGTPMIQKNGELYLLEVENPLVADHLRARVQKLGYASDGSFSPSMVKLSLSAMVALIESYLSDAESKRVQKALVKAGAPDTSINGVLRGFLKGLGKKLASDVGEELMDKAHGYLQPVINASVQEIGDRFTELFNE